MNYDDLKRIAKETKVSVRDLIVMAPQNDPFYAGTEGDKIKAHWFADMWQRFGYSTGVHLRRIHYQIVSQGDSKDCNGKPYENTKECWSELGNAARAARYLGLVPVGSFIDARNPPAKVYHGVEYVPESPWLYLPDDDWQLPSIAPQLEFSLNFPMPEVCGYRYQPEDQEYLLEVWCEKSTMNDVLNPLCRKYRANFVTGLGFLSITAVDNLIERAVSARKPTRIFYISDFDPAGSFMPQQIARQIEFWLQQKDLNHDVALTPLALTKEQVVRYELPRIPIKDTDRRASNFEDKHGEGAVELDALEALFPGSLEAIVRNGMDDFIDQELPARLSSAEDMATEWLERQWDEGMEYERSRFNEIAHEVAVIAEGYRDRLAELAAELDQEITPYRQELDQLRQAITEKVYWLERVLPDRPSANPQPDDEDWLFRSDRDYMDQLKRYKA